MKLFYQALIALCLLSGGAMAQGVDCSATLDCPANPDGSAACPGSPCQSDGIDCTIDQCHPTIPGECTHVFEDSLCAPDSHECTVERCTANGCVVELRDDFCEAGDGSCVARECDANAGCVSRPQSTECEDNLSCTINICSPDGGGGTGGCIRFDAPGVCDDGIPCTRDLCAPSDPSIPINPTTGCAHVTDESLCDDGIECTVDTCDPNSGCINSPQNGLCNDGFSCTDDACVIGVGCVYTPTNDSSRQCNDFVPCTDDACVVGQGCVFTNNSENCDDNVPCTRDSCSPGTPGNIGGCVFQPDDGLCLEGSGCAVGRCTSGGCIYEASDDNCDDSVECTIDECDPVLGCIFTAEDANCDDNTTCTIDTCDDVEGCQFESRDSLCSDGITCTIDTCGGSGVGCEFTPDNSRCDDGIPCTTDVCDPVRGCVFTADNNACDDSVDCTTNVCSKAAGGCVFTADNSACDDGVECTLDTCDPVNGCVHTPLDTGCNDGIPCTSDVCTLTGCIFTENDSLCDDGLDCTTDTCSNVNGCVFTGNDGACDDGINCTTDTCVPGVGCVFDGSDAACDDGIACTEDLCDAGSDCFFRPVNRNCNDGFSCTVDICDPDQGCLALENDGECDDGIACTVDTCDPTNPSANAATGCVHTPDSLACNDLEPCTDDMCDPVLGCVSTPNAALCNDGVDCTRDKCDPARGCVNIPDNSMCSDGVSCTENICDRDLGCQFNPIDRNCNDRVDCTVDSCVAGIGCDNTPVDSLCDDGVDCTDDTCNGKRCVFTANDASCDDGIACTVDTCDKNMGCMHAEDDSACDDGIPCTTDMCIEGVGCMNVPDDDSCFDPTTCADDVCAPSDPSADANGCVGTPDDFLCIDFIGCTDQVCDVATLKCQRDSSRCSCECEDDEVACTIDDCDQFTGKCTHVQDHTQCDDGIACTEDFCDGRSGCTNDPNDSMCNDGFDCTVDYCDPGYGCVHLDTGCVPPSDVNSAFELNTFDGTTSSYNWNLDLGSDAVVVCQLGSNSGTGANNVAAVLTSLGSSGFSVSEVEGSAADTTTDPNAGTSCFSMREGIWNFGGTMVQAGKVELDGYVNQSDLRSNAARVAVCPAIENPVVIGTVQSGGGFATFFSYGVDVTQGPERVTFDQGTGLPESANTYLNVAASLGNLAGPTPSLHDANPVVHYIIFDAGTQTLPLLGGESVEVVADCTGGVNGLTTINTGAGTDFDGPVFVNFAGETNIHNLRFAGISDVPVADGAFQVFDATDCDSPGDADNDEFVCYVLFGTPTNAAEVEYERPCKCVDADPEDCVLNTCSPFTGQCQEQPVDSLCSDKIACTVDVCDPANGCTHLPDDSLCDDGIECTTDICTETGCIHDDTGCDCHLFLSGSEDSWARYEEFPIPADEWTIEFRIRTEDCTREGTVLSYCAGNGDGCNEVAIHNHQDVRVFVDDQKQRTGNNLATGEWVWVALTWNGQLQPNADRELRRPAGALSVFIDGMHSANYRLAPESTLVNNGTLIFGQDQDWFNMSHFEGEQALIAEIDDVRIFDHVRSAAEINADVTAEFDGTESGLIAAWTFDCDAPTIELTGNFLELQIGDAAGVNVPPFPPVEEH